RARLGVFLASVVVVGIAVGVDPFRHPETLWQLYAIKLPVLFFAAYVWRISRDTTSARLLRVLASLTILTGAVTSLSSILVGEEWSASILCMLTAMTVAGLFAWGVRTQVVVASTLLALGMLPVVIVGDGSKVAFIGLVSGALAFGSVLVAHEQERYRRA